MPCPACVGAAGTVVLGGGELLFVRDPSRIRNWSILGAAVLAWGLYFLLMRGHASVRISLEITSILLLIAAVIRVYQLRARGVRSVVHLWLGKVWGATAVMVNHPLVLVIKLTLLGIWVFDIASSSISISSVWYGVLLTLLVALLLIRIPRGIEEWRASARTGCPFGFKKAR